MLFSWHILAPGDVYRRDSIDQSHYPVFHQMEGALAARHAVLAVHSQCMFLHLSASHTVSTVRSADEVHRG